MQIRLCAVGRMRKGAEQALFDAYTARLRPSLTLQEIDIRQKLAPARLTASEGEMLLAAAAQAEIIVALDERGDTPNSRAFAQRLARWRDDGVREIAFLIGGADGLNDHVRNSAHYTLSLGAMTWPHLMVRGLLAEQLYRAQQINAGHPYHRD
ncbi:MAG: 23S rRNA (pseudouridine(1915)-N(3))-methyltransferase RlmH [Alphaproteobacteria bacterium]